jgi:hypothetical protein
MKFKKSKKTKYREVYILHDYPYCNIEIISFYKDNLQYYYIVIKVENSLIYDSIRDDNAIYSNLEDAEDAVIVQINNYRDFNGKINTEY